MSTIDPITGLTIPASVTDNSTAWTPPPLGVICTTITVNGKTVESNPPQIINSGDGQVKGGPTNPQICRGYIENTAISASNNNKVHVCDTTLYIRRKVNLGKIAEKVVIAAREALNWIMEFLGITPGGNGLVEQIKVWSIWLKEKITWIKEMLVAVESYVSIIREIRDVILYILSLLCNYKNSISYNLSTKPKHKMQSAVLLQSIISNCPTIFKLFTSMD
jgi:hypothetical protein